eukprot:TRINITY_DN68737_c0_g1_i1.p1 TRINITY_DN68737_c0_g1~~TRINITY_DN68737_c0_g1_i1.p1  ORF type:complete len:624 (-),score=122.28 TRINITY_DN68737_c0_g1_i1:210-2081(-)
MAHVPPIGAASAASAKASDDEFAAAKAYLLKAGPDGHSVYQHLYEIVLSQLKKPDPTLLSDPKSFAELSRTMKESRPRDEAYDAADAFWRAARRSPASLAAAEAALRHFALPKPTVETRIEKPNPATTITTTTVKHVQGPPFREPAADLRYMAAAGVVLSQEDATLLGLTVCRLAMAKQLSEVRYFGRVLGTHGHYDIVESLRYFPDGHTVIPPEPFVEVKTRMRSLPIPTPVEPPGRGLNRWSYWVRPSNRKNYRLEGIFPEPEPGADEWFLLPDVTPQQIVAARAIRRRFVGALDAPVVTHPPFPGLERNYLRTQIARVQAATVVSPSGALAAVEPDSEEDVEDGPAATKLRPLLEPVTAFADDVAAGGGVAVFASSARWVHARPHIGLNGRATAPPARPIPDDEVEEEEVAVNPPAVEPALDDNKPLLEPLIRDAAWHTVLIPQPPPQAVDDDEMGDSAPGTMAEEADLAQTERPPSRWGQMTVADDGYDDDQTEEGAPPRRRTPAWLTHVVNPTRAAAAATAVAKSVRWPGAVAWLGGGGRDHGCVYIGTGLPRLPRPHFPQLPPEPRQEETEELVFQADPSAKAEKLVIRGEPMPATEDEETGLHDEDLEEEEREEDE